MPNSPTIIVNFFAGPGSGKSTITAGVFSELKSQDINAEVAWEYAKELCWEERHATVTDQIYLFGKQYHRLFRLLNKVDVILTDSPIILGINYRAEDEMTQEFNALVLKAHNSFNTLNYFIERTKKYNPCGRFQDEQGAREMDTNIKEILDKYGIGYGIISGCQNSVKIVADLIIKRLEEL